MVRHSARPGRLCVEQHLVLRYRRSGIRRSARRDIRIVGIPHYRGLDRGGRRRIRFRVELERQGRISLRRSRQQQLHHYRHVERLPVRTVARRRQLSLLIATRKNSIATSRPLFRGRNFFAWRFRAKWGSVRVKKTRQSNSLGPDAIRTGMRDLRGNHQVDRLGPFALFVRFDLECDALSFGQILQPRALHRGDVNEHIAAAVIGLDEAIASFSIEELDRTSHGHRETPPPYALPPRLSRVSARPEIRRRKAWPPERIERQTPIRL